MSKPNPLREKPTPKRRQIDFFRRLGGFDRRVDVCERESGSEVVKKFRVSRKHQNKRGLLSFPIRHGGSFF